MKVKRVTAILTEPHLATTGAKDLDPTGTAEW